MKRLSSPPLLILLDVLFIFLFVSVLQNPPKMEYILPKDKLFKGALLLVVSDNHIKWYDAKKESYISKKEFSRTHTHPFFCSVPCGEQQECKKLRRKVSSKAKLYIAITGNLYDTISKITHLACNSGSGECNNIKFTVTSDGKIDGEKLFEDNPKFYKDNNLKYIFLNEDKDKIY